MGWFLVSSYTVGREGRGGTEREGGRDRRREGGREGEVEQDLLSILKCELVPCLLLLGRVRETGREQDLLLTLPCGLVNCILLRGREGGRVAGREGERNRGGRQAAGLLPTSTCISSSKKLFHECNKSQEA